MDVVVLNSYIHTNKVNTNITDDEIDSDSNYTCSKANPDN